MDIPQPPPDEETRNIIDRLANFVARNGVEFEGMTKQKQKDNPKFQFLFGGEYYNYYTYRVTSEQALLKHQAMRQQQQQQPQMQQGLMGQNFGSHFGPSAGGPPGPGPRGPSRFGPPIQQNFDRPMGGPAFDQRQQFQNYDHQPRFPPRGGNFGNFERGPHPASGPNPFDQRMNFERGPGPNFQGQGPVRPGFERQPGPGFDFDFERNPGGNRFDSSMRPHLNMPQSSRFDSPTRPNMQRVPAPNFDFERTPNLGFEQARGPAAFGNQNNFEAPTVPATIALPMPTPPAAINIEALNAKKAGIQEQILQSENNLAAQHQVLLSQQQTQVEEALRQAQDAEIISLATELNIDITEFDKLLQCIMDSCTKESISNGKGWIFTHTSTPRHYDLITAYLLRKVTDPKLTFSQRLHIIYLVNDTLHHCVRRGAADIQQALEKMVIPMFCFTKVNETDNAENLAKLNKLFSLWEAKPNYVSKIAVEKLNNFSHTWLEYKNEIVTRHAVIVTQIATNIQKTYEGYQSQHLLFVHHMNQNIKQIDQQLEDFRLQTQQYQLDHERYLAQQEQIRVEQEQLRQKQEALHRQQQEQRQQQQQIPIMRPAGPPGIMPGMSTGGLLPSPGTYPHAQGPPGSGMVQGPNFMPGQGMGLLGDKPIGAGSQQDILDISRPPPGFANQTNPVLEIPRLPYFELPAGLMVPLVKPEDDNYKPIDPKAIRLPPPCPPSERLMQAVEAFYGPPSHDNPRDSEGWERLGLYEYYKNKNLARKQKEDDIREGRREKSRSPSPIRREVSPSGRSPPRRRYQSKSPTPSKRRRTRSPRSPTSRRSNSGRRKRSRSRSPIRRSPTPPSFGTAGLGMASKLDESNKGHQLLRKMGWGGTGLGANEQGIEAPIDGGDVRDRKDQYKGVGVNLHDPFESYRKTKGQAFVDRMRQRAEDRP